YVHAELGACVQQTGARRIFTHHARRLVLRYSVGSVGETRPGLAVIIGAIDIWREIAEQITIDRDVRRAGAVRRRIDRLDATTRRKILGRDVGPRLSIVARYVDRAVVGTGPYQTLLQRRFANH